MTTPLRIITCETFSDGLMDFMDGGLDATARSGMEGHARSCRACGALLADLRRVTAQAVALPSITPSRDLWPGIAARIQAPAIAIASRRPAWRSRAFLIAGIAATFVVAAVLGYATTHRGTPAPGVAGESTRLAPRGPRLRTPNARLAAATPSAVEASYATEIVGLRAIIDARRSQLDPKTIAIVERNLRIVDDAIAACKAALAHDSASQFLIQSLDQSLDTKVQLLRTVAMLPSGS